MASSAHVHALPGGDDFHGSRDLSIADGMAGLAGAAVDRAAAVAGDISVPTEGDRRTTGVGQGGAKRG